MCFPSRWRFEPGTALALTLEISGRGERVRTEGVVVGCEPAGEKLWSVTLLFLDGPSELANLQNPKATIRDNLSESLSP